MLTLLWALTTRARRRGAGDWASAKRPAPYSPTTRGRGAAATAKELKAIMVVAIAQARSLSENQLRKCTNVDDRLVDPCAVVAVVVRVLVRASGGYL